MNNIEEKWKAFIKYPVRSSPTPDKSYVAVKVSELDELETERDEMFEALIEAVVNPVKFSWHTADVIKLIEKATDKSWEEFEKDFKLTEGEKSQIDLFNWHNSSV